MPNDRNERTDPTDGLDGASREPRTEDLGRRDFAGASYGATEREQTRDLRRTDPGEPSDDAAESADDANADMANDENGE